jgi:hypothetical protein
LFTLFALAGASLLGSGCDRHTVDDDVEIENQKAALSVGAPALGSGILWHLPNGEVRVWDMATGTDAKDVLVGTADRNVWRPLATGDFDGDGAGDIMLRTVGTTDPTSLMLMHWFLTDTRTKGASSPTKNAPVVGSTLLTPLTGDFNGDGTTDLTWLPSGGNGGATWIIAKGTTSPSSITTYPAGTDAVLAVGDFERDDLKKADLLRRRASDGMVTVETYGGARQNLEVIAADWKVYGTGDFNGDRANDVLWWNTTTGGVQVWYMTPTTTTAGVFRVASKATLGTVTLASGWAISGVGDFNHDGVSDILWTNPAAISVWTLAGNGTVTEFGAPVFYPAGATFSGVINLGAPTAPTNITSTPQLSQGIDQFVTVRWTGQAQRTGDSIEVWENYQGALRLRASHSTPLVAQPATFESFYAASAFQGGLKACIRLRAREQGRVSDYSNEHCFAGLPNPVAKLDFTMQPRFGLDADKDGAIDLVPTPEDVSALRLNQWPVTLDSCASTDPVGGTITNFFWKHVKPDGSNIVLASGAACRAPVSLPAGLDKIALTTTTADGRATTTNFDINVKNTFIVAMGDAYASGQGNPTKDGALVNKIVWQPPVYGTAADDACGRSANAGVARAAIALERQDPRSSVIFLDVSCAGAKIDSIAKTPQAPNTLTQVALMKSILCAKGWCVGTPTIDAVVLSVGISDLRTGMPDHMYACSGNSKQPACPTWGDYGQAFLGDVFNLENYRFPELKAALSSAWVSKVFLAEYPDPSFSETGALCTSMTLERAGATGNDVTLSAETVAFYSGIFKSLNDSIGRVAATNASAGWNLVGGMTSAFSKHGYCAPDHWISHFGESVAVHRTSQGTLLPNAAGHSAYARQLLAALAAKGVAGDSGTTFWVPSGKVTP